jgi:hypothetical protein
MMTVARDNGLSIMTPLVGTAVERGQQRHGSLRWNILANCANRPLLLGGLTCHQLASQFFI